MTNSKNILFLCTGNSARSIMAEGVTNDLSKGRYKAYSAGSKPTGTPHPMAIATLEKFGIDSGFARSKNWNNYSQNDPNSPKIDIVVTVCDNAANEVCPVWHGSPLSTHWGMEDPARFEGSIVMQQARFDTVFSTLRKRIKALLEIEFSSLSQEGLDKIGKISI